MRLCIPGKISQQNKLESNATKNGGCLIAPSVDLKFHPNNSGSPYYPSGPSIVRVSAIMPDIPALLSGTIATTRTTTPHTAATVSPPYVQSKFTGTTAGNRHYSTGTIEGPLLYHNVCTGFQSPGEEVWTLRCCTVCPDCRGVLDQTEEHRAPPKNPTLVVAKFLYQGKTTEINNNKKKRPKRRRGGTT